MFLTQHQAFTPSCVYLREVDQGNGTHLHYMQDAFAQTIIDECRDHSCGHCLELHGQADYFDRQRRNQFRQQINNQFAQAQQQVAQQQALQQRAAQQILQQAGMAPQPFQQVIIQQPPTFYQNNAFAANYPTPSYAPAAAPLPAPAYGSRPTPSAQTMNLMFGLTSVPMI